MNWKTFAETWDLNKELSEIDLRQFDLSELTWIKDVLKNRIFQILEGDLDLIDAIATGFSVNRNYLNQETIFYNDRFVWSKYHRLCLPGEWIEKCKQYAAEIRAEQEKQKEIQKLNERESLIQTLLGNIEKADDIDELPY